MRPQQRDPVAFERDGHLYLISPVAPFTPADSEIEEFAFAEDVRRIAPNPNILWMRGQYVEADHPNDNGALWTSEDIAIASLTPNLMPVTVMHDPRTAVGLIADTRLVTREQGGQHGRLDNTIGIWRHRFPEVAEEAQANYESGSLMQSMECLPTHYDCAVCGLRYPKLPGGAEQANWCGHLRGEEGAKAARILRNVCFTGTGLIFGTRGARGAYKEANLEVLQEEVAEHHDRVHRDTSTKTKRTRSKGHMELEDTRYQELIAAEGKARDLEKRVGELEETAAKVPELETKVETAEAATTKAEGERDELKTKVEEHAESERQGNLAKDRLGKLGKGFMEKLGDFTRGRLEEQAKSLTDEEWDSRLQELEETAAVKRDEGGTEDEGADKGSGSEAGTFSREETARSQAGKGGGNGGNGQEPSGSARRSVVAGLVKRSQPDTAKTE